MKKIRTYLIIITLLGIIRGLAAHQYVEKTSTPLIYKNIDEIPKDQTILLLGTSPRAPDGRPNTFYTQRIKAVKKIRETGKVKKILVSGDNEHISYNEPKAMKKTLIKEGIPRDIIELDYAGFRTLDSVVRASDVFNAENILIVSQSFHIRRALTIATYKGIKAKGYTAKGPGKITAFRVYMREVLARMWMTLDLLVLKTKPRFPQ